MNEVILPNGWAMATVGDLADYVNGRAFKPTEWKDAGKPIIRIQNLNKDDAKYNFSPENHEEKYLVRNGDLLFAWSASLGAYIWHGGDAWLNQHIFIVHPKKCTTKLFVFYLLEKITAELYAKAHGSGMVHVTKGKFESTEISLPPLNEQHRIVAKTEELFSELDKGIENLKTARAQLKVYRQALLKHAFEGKLTSISSDAAWAEKTLGDLLDFLTSGSRGWAQYYAAAGDLFIRAQNIKHDLLELDDIAFVSLPERAEGLRAQVKKGDLLITITGANVTKSALVERDVGTAYVSQHVALCRPTTEVFPRFLYWFIVAEAAGRKQLSDMAYGAGKPGLNLENIRSVQVPLPGLPDQQRIVELIEGKLSEVDQLELTIATVLQQAEALRQSILKKAFSGQLVAQDANDEPASALLARIKAERAVQAAMAKPRKPQKVHAQSAPAKTNVIPFPVKIPNISATDLHAGILARAYQHHEHSPKYLANFGHVKAEKIVHLVEAHLGIDLEREPVKAAAGPNDFSRLINAESRARKMNWFDVRKQKKDGAYVLTKGDKFDALLLKTRNALGERAGEVDILINKLLPLNRRQAEIVATLYAAWNNLLLLGCSSSDDDIVCEARENWHDSKLKIERDKFFRGLKWMREQGLVPAGKGRHVGTKK
ncbi:MAG: restriction endonuclease subunit S [Gallionella sp.]|nr:restriction endonuclease subunit S [Gallionella sp.]